MKKTTMIILPLISILLSCCTSTLSNKISYDASFDSIDSSKDGIIEDNEFTALFPKSEEKLFNEADADKDGKIYPDEWYEFRAKQGYINP